MSSYDFLDTSSMVEQGTHNSLVLGSIPRCRTMFLEREYIMNKGQYIVGSLQKSNGAFSASPSPVTHKTLADAQAEAQRLAIMYTTKRFVVLKVEGIVHATTVTWE